jgi:hypothetical protein
MPRCAPMRPCNADEATRPINGVVASDRSPTRGKRHGGRGNAAWPTRGTEGRSGQAIGMQRLTSSCQLPSFLPHWKTQPPSKRARAPRLRSAYVSAASPRGRPRTPPRVPTCPSPCARPIGRPRLLKPCGPKPTNAVLRSVSLE